MLVWKSWTLSGQSELNILCGHVVKSDYSAALVERSARSLSERHCTACGLNLYWWLSYFPKSCKKWNDNGMFGGRISAEVSPCYWQYSASHSGSHTEASLLTSDTLRFNCLVFRSSNSTLYNINTVDVAYKLIWPYLIKMDSWFYLSRCPTPSRLTCSESLQLWWLKSTETF